MSEGTQDADDGSLVGRVIADRYRVLRVLGEGGMGAIYVAEHLALHKRVALKVVRPMHAGNEAAAARFAREAMVTARIDHPNVISALDYGPLDDGGAFLAMQLVEGGTLTDLLREQGALPWARAANLGAQVADAVMAAEKHGIVHRDLKPDNILLQRTEDGSDQVKVLDFGIAKFSRDSLAPPAVRAAQRVTQTGMVVGTPGYMAPEQALGEPTDHRSDLYSLGVLLWECIAGRRLWSGSSVRGIVRKQLKESAPGLREYTGNDGIPVPLDELVALLTARDMERRPHDIQAVRDLLRDVATGAHHSGGLAEPSGEALAEQVVPPRPGASAEDRPLTTTPGLIAPGEPSTGDPIASADHVATPRPGEPGPLAEPAPDRAGLRRDSAFSDRPETPRLWEGVESAVSPSAARPDAKLANGPPRSRYAVWGGMFAASVLVGLALGLLTRGATAPEVTTPEPRPTATAQRANLPAPRAHAAREPRDPARVPPAPATALPQALASRLATLVHADGRSARVAAAEALLSHMPVGEVPSYARALAHLQLAETCPAKRDLVQTLASLGDPRALPALVMMSQRGKAGCGPHNRDCMACMRDELDATIGKLEQRQSGAN